MSELLLNKILRYTCKYFNVTIEDVKGQIRETKFVDARAVYAISAKKYIDNVTTIMDYLGDKDRSTFYNWIDRPRSREVNDALYYVESKLNGERNLTVYQELLEEHLQMTQDIRLLEKKIEQQKKLI